MVVEARIGILTHRLRVDDREVRVRRARAGWYAIPAEVPGPDSRVWYSPFSDRVRIEAPEGTVDIQFRVRKTAFDWRGRTYRVRSLAWGRVTVEDEGGRPIVQGTVTWSGVRLERVGPELAPIARELALGLAFRVAWIWAGSVAIAAG